MGLIEQEVFGANLISKISEISGSYQITSNNDRIDAILDVIEDYGFEEIGSGTNRTCVYNKDFGEDICFKIAIDGRGERDNNLETFLCRDEILKPYVPEVYDNTGLILAQRRLKDMTKKKFKKHKDECEEIIHYLSKYFLIDDAGPLVWNNWGLDENNNPKIIDYAYFTRLDNLINIRCKKCGGKLLYDKNLTFMKCKKCGRRHTFAELKGQYIADPLVEAGFKMFDSEYKTDDKDRAAIEAWLNS